MHTIVIDCVKLRVSSGVQRTLPRKHKKYDWEFLFHVFVRYVFWCEFNALKNLRNALKILTNYVSNAL